MAPASLSYSATVILQAIANGYQYGFDVMDATGLPSGTVYPALRRMEDAGLLRANWEKAAVAQREQRPARRYYEVTSLGAQALSDALARYRQLGNAAPVAPKPAPRKA